MEQDSEQDSLDLKRYIGLVLSWWWFIILGALAGGTGAYFISANQTPIYQASTIILVQQNQSALPTVADIQASQSLARTYQELITLRPVLEEVTQELELSRSANDLNEAIDVALVRDTQLLRLTVRDPDPKAAADIANTLAQVFIERTTEARLLDIGRLREAAAAHGVADPAVLAAVQLEAIGVLSQVEEAIVPTGSILPRTRANIMTAVVLGGLVALGAGFLVENLTDTVRSPGRLERVHGLSNLGIVPRWRSKDVTDGQIVASTHRQSSYAEAFRQIRTNMEFATAGQQAKVFLVTSPGTGEGKTSCVANLAAAIAQTGKTAVVVDADMRRPDLYRYFGLPRSQPGLSTVLALPGGAVEYVLQVVPVAGVRMLSSGPTPPNPAELLGLPCMTSLLQHLREEADVVLVDSPPVLVAVDSVVLASQVDGVVLVVDVDHTRMDALGVATASLRKTGTRILGVVFNKLKTNRYLDATSDHYDSRSLPGSEDGAAASLETGNGLPGHVAEWFRSGWSRVGRRRSKRA